MNIDAHIGTFYVFQYAKCYLLGHGPVLFSGKQTVQIHVKKGNSSRNGINPQRIQRRIDLHNSLQMFHPFPDPPVQLVADILSFQFVAVGPCHNTDPLLSTCAL